jgi:copper chaperone CopZ
MSISAVTMSPAVCACLLSLCVVWGSEEVLAAERTALALVGSSCRESQPAIIAALTDVDGVDRVHMELIPDHVFIDHDGQTLNEERLAGIVNSLPRLGGRCEAVLMRSCITAPARTDAVMSHRAP